MSFTRGTERVSASEVRGFESWSDPEVDWDSISESGLFLL